jgi:hypothetical protein
VLVAQRQLAQARVEIGGRGHLSRVRVTTFGPVTARRLTSAVLAALAGVLAVAGAVCWSIDHGIVSENAFADRAVSALHRDAVQAAVSTEIDAQVQSHVPAAAASPAEVRAIVDRIVAGASFERVYRDGARVTNRALFHNDGRDATLQVNLARVLRPESPQLAAVVGDRDVTILSLDAGRTLERTSRAADLIGLAGVALPFWAAAAFVGALFLAPRPSRAVVAAGLGAAVTGALVFAGAYVVRAVAEADIEMAGVPDADARAAAAAAWSVFTADVRLIAVIAVIVGLAATVIALVASRRPT